MGVEGVGGGVGGGGVVGWLAAGWQLAGWLAWWLLVG